MHIIISGAQCTGKSSLIKKIKEFFPDFNYQKEFVRKTLGKEEVNFADTKKQFKILENQKKFLMQEGNCIADRGPLDSLSYSSILYKKGLSNISSEDMDNLKKESLDFLKSNYVDYVILLTHKDVPLIEDGYRTMDDSQRDEVENEMLYYMNNDDILWEKLIILSGSLEDKVDFLKNLINNNCSF